ncbi:lasso peptide biosynthesis B2 protein [Pseudomonas vanderleydeniana]|uniref:Lasso peptide biosynthesis B2 protein n=1 Tax=Pseudomonas vanderleydeniana TaxID=2745495 RepID=A0A9E6PH09_9PSED|nr:lasso peptide biosynthesis B2 protein [Pseudomonas vanderleydeniana]
MISAHRLRVIEAVLLFSVTPVLCHLFSWRLLLSLSGARIESASPHLNLALSPTARAVRDAVAVAVRRLPWKPLCLRQALVAACMLRLRGRRSVLCLGVRREGDSIGAHAWLVLTGKDGGVVCGAENMGNFRALKQQN